jgi:hypothetical protein
MLHPLELKLARIRRKARQFVLSKAVSRALVLVLWTGVALTLVDALFRYQDRGLRAISSLILLTVVTLAARGVWRAIRGSRMSDVQIAKRLERAYPSLRGRLASAVEFVREPADDPLAGSADLRRAVIRDTSAAIDELDLSTALDARPARRALLSLGISLVAVFLLIFVGGSTSRVALLRLVSPLGDFDWPRVNQLAIVAPVDRLPHGQNFEVEVVDQTSSVPPDDVVMHYRFHGPDGEVSEEIEPLHAIGGQLLARRENVERPFEYRAVGGDDYTMPWTALDVVEPPAVRSTRLMLHFPAYTGWEPRASDANLRALVGTKVQLEATFTKPLSEAALRMTDDVTIPATLRADGYGATIAADAEPPFEVRASGPYRFVLTDREGFHNDDTTRYEIRAVPDAPPTAEIEQPKANLYVTPDAVLSLSLNATDDLAVHGVSLEYLRSDKSDAGSERLELFVGPESVSAEVATASAAEGYAGDRRALTYEWQLTPLGLPPGVQLTFHASVTDYAGQTGQSLPRRLTIVTAEEAQDRLVDRQGVIFNELSRVLQLQQAARSHVAGLEVQLEQTGKLKKSDIDALQGAGLNQQQAERELTNEHEGLRGQANDLLEELQINKIDGPDTKRQMQDLLDRLSRLADGPLPEAGRGLAAAIKTAQVELQDKTETAPGKAAGIKAPLEEAAQAQDEVAESLAQMLDEMKQWASFRHFHREVGQVAKAQEELAEETAKLGQQTLSRASGDLEPQQRADLQKLAQRQLDLARRLDRLEQQMDESAAAARQEDPLAADSMADAIEQARRQGVAETMRQAGRGVEQNRISQATQGQRQAANELREMLDILSSRRENELGRLVKKLREAEQDLARLANEQQGLQKKLKTAEKLPEEERRRELERLTREQRQLQEEAKRFARKLERLQAENAGANVAEAGGKMGQASDSGEAGEAGSAAEQAQAAEQDLEDAQRELAARRREAETDLAQEQLARMEDAVASLHERQQKLVGETIHYQLREKERGNLTRAEAASVRELARNQSALRDEMQELSKTLAGAEVFQFVLEIAGGDMTRAAERLDQRDLGDQTLMYENSALARIAQLKSALDEDAAPKSEKPDDEQGGGEGGGQEGSGKKTGSLAELKLLKAIQGQINSRTTALAEAKSQPSPDKSQQESEFELLSREQGRLADLVTNLMQTTDQRPEDHPERLPDLRRETPSQPNGGAPHEESP